MNRWVIWMTIAFSVNCVPAVALNYEVEPNNSSTQAMPIALGQTIRGNIGSVSDVDDFKVVPSSSTSLRVLFSRPPRGYQYNIATIRVLDSAGTALASVDAYAPDVYTSFDVGVTAGDAYTVEITGCQETSPGQDCTDHRSETYELVVLNLPTPVFESEPNGSVAQADLLPANGWVFAQHSTESDVDFFRIDLPGPGDVFAQLTRPSDPYLYSLSNIAILDSNGNLLNSDHVFAANGQGRVVVGVSAASTLYIRVTSCQNSSRCDIVFSNPYQVVTGFRAASPCELIFFNGFDCSGGKPSTQYGAEPVKPEASLWHPVQVEYARE